MKENSSKASGTVDSSFSTRLLINCVTVSFHIMSIIMIIDEIEHYCINMLYGLFLSLDTNST